MATRIPAYFFYLRFHFVTLSHDGHKCEVELQFKVFSFLTNETSNSRIRIVIIFFSTWQQLSCPLISVRRLIFVITVIYISFPALFI